MTAELWDASTDDHPQPIEGGERRLGRYMLYRELAAGGMGTVYLARVADAEGLDRPIAIKVIHRHLARRRDLVEMFQDEARIHARIQHPNVCSVFDFGQAEGTFFLAMEYLLGESLASVLREVGRREAMAESARWPALVARLFVDACEGLHAAHELKDEQGAMLGVVHRDVSPQNLFVTYDGHMKLLDFGVALARGRVHETVAGGVKGKLAYMAPEQARLDKPDRRADVWGLGVCLWEALTVRRLFKNASEMGILGAVDRGDIVPPSARTAAPIPPELDAIVMRCLTRDVEQRTPSARALGRELAAWLHAYPEPVGPGDVAELLGELFAPRRGAKRELVTTMLSTNPPGDVGEATTTSPDGHAPAGGDPTRTPTLLPRLGMGAPSAETPSTLPRDAPRGATSSVAAPVAAVAAALVVGAIGVGVGVWVGGGAEEPTRLGVLPTLEPASPPPTVSLPPPETSALAAPEIPPTAENPEGVEDPRDITRRRGRGAGRPRATPTETTPSEPLAPGSVNVVTPGGWADVVVDGRVVGRTPRQMTLPAGTQTIELRPFGRSPGDRVEVHVEPGRTARVVRPVAR